MKISWIFLLILIAPAIANAKIICLNNNSSIDVVLGEHLAEYVFLIKNTSKTLCKIKSITPACSCLLVKLSTAVIAPNAVERIYMTFDLEKKASVLKGTAVIICESEDQPLEINVTVNKRRLIHYDTRLLIWKTKDDLKPKSIYISLYKDATLKLKIPDDSAFTFSLIKSLNNDSLYELKVAPKSTSLVVTSSYELEAETSNNPSLHQFKESQQFYATVLN